MLKTQKDWKWEDEKYISCNQKRLKSWGGAVISDIIDFKTKARTKDKKGALDNDKGIITLMYFFNLDTSSNAKSSLIALSVLSIEEMSPSTHIGKLTKNVNTYGAVILDTAIITYTAIAAKGATFKITTKGLIK